LGPSYIGLRARRLTIMVATPGMQPRPAASGLYKAWRPPEWGGEALRRNRPLEGYGSDATGIAVIEASARYDALCPKLMAMDTQTQSTEMRRMGAAPDVAIGSVHAITEQGERARHPSTRVDADRRQGQAGAGYTKSRCAARATAWAWESTPSLLNGEVTSDLMVFSLRTSRVGTVRETLASRPRLRAPGDVRFGTRRVGDLDNSPAIWWRRPGSQARERGASHRMARSFRPTTAWGATCLCWLTPASAPTRRLPHRPDVR